MGVILKHINEPPPNVTSVAPELPEELDEIIAKAMAKPPEARYQTASALADAVLRVAGASAISGAPTMLRRAAQASVQSIRQSGKSARPRLRPRCGRSRPASRQDARPRRRRSTTPTVTTPTDQRAPLPLSRRARTPLLAGLRCGLLVVVVAIIVLAAGGGADLGATQTAAARRLSRIRPAPPSLELAQKPQR
jgi:serine/threonine-protein kinase